MLNEDVKETMKLFLDWAECRSDSSDNDVSGRLSESINRFSDELVKLNSAISDIKDDLVEIKRISTPVVEPPVVNDEKVNTTVVKPPVVTKKTAGKNQSVTKNRHKLAVSTRDYRMNNPDEPMQWEENAVKSKPAFELINGEYIKNNRGRGKYNKGYPAKVFYDIQKKIIGDAEVFTNRLYYECTDYLKENSDIKQGNFERMLCHLWHGKMDDCLREYHNHMLRKVNPKFEVFGGRLKVNGRNTKLKISTIREIISNRPTNRDECEVYTRALIDKYTECPSACIRTIVENHDNYSLLNLIRDDTAPDRNRYGK